MHSYTNPIIEVEDDQATGNWPFWIANSGCRHEGRLARQHFIERAG